MARRPRFRLPACLFTLAALASACGFTYEPDPGMADPIGADGGAFVDAYGQADAGAEPDVDAAIAYDGGADAWPVDQDMELPPPCDPPDGGMPGEWDGDLPDGEPLPDAEAGSDAGRDPCPPPPGDAGAADAGVHDDAGAERDAGAVED